MDGGFNSNFWANGCTKWPAQERKTEKSRRSIMLAPLVVELLKQQRVRQLEAKLQAGEAWQERGLVFCTSVRTPLNPSKVINRFKTLLKKAGLPEIRFYDLRHKVLSELKPYLG